MPIHQNALPMIATITPGLEATRLSITITVMTQMMTRGVGGRRLATDRKLFA